MGRPLRSLAAVGTLGTHFVNKVESKYIEKKQYLSRYVHERTVALRDLAARKAVASGSEAECLRAIEKSGSRACPYGCRANGRARPFP